MSDLQGKIEELEGRISIVENEIRLLKENKQAQHDQEYDLSTSITLPEELVESIKGTKEEIAFQLLWSFSSKKVMSVREFLDSTRQKGFILSHTWLPSEGGRFSTKFVKKGIFRQVKPKEKTNEKFWAMTDVGKIRVAKLIDALMKNIN